MCVGPRRPPSGGAVSVFWGTSTRRLSTGGHRMKEQIRNHLGEAGLVNPSQVIDLCRRQGIQMVDFRFADLVGTWQHFSAPADELDESMFIEGVGFDGSSIRGFQAIDESDMLLVPDARTARVDPVLHVPTLLLICDIVDPVTRERYTRDPRYIAQKAEGFLTGTGIATTTYWGPEAEFFVFDDVRYEQTQHSAFYAIDSAEGAWNSGRDEKPNLGYKPRHKEGYFPAPPADSLQDFRSELVMKMKEAGMGWRCTTTRWPPPASARSTCASRR